MLNLICYKLNNSKYTFSDKFKILNTKLRIFCINITLFSYLQFLVGQSFSLEKSSLYLSPRNNERLKEKKIHSQT